MSWEEYKKLVMEMIKENKKEHDRMCETLVKIREDISGLKVKASVWGILGGLIPVLITIAGMLLMGVK